MFEVFEGDIAQLVEGKMVVRVNSKGKRTRRKKCRPGYKLSGDGKTCVKISAKEKLNRKRGLKRSQVKRRSTRASSTRKRLKARKYRKQAGIK